MGVRGQGRSFIAGRGVLARRGQFGLVLDSNPVEPPLFAAPGGDLAGALRVAPQRIRIGVKQGHVIREE